MIQYRKSDNSLGEIDGDKLSRVDVNGNTFTVTIRHTYYDEWDFEDEEITDIIELRIG